MADLVLKMSISIDGFVAAARPDSDWMFRGSTPDSAAWVRDVLAGAGTHVVGRRLFETWIGLWPTSDSPMAAPINDAPKVVVTRQTDFDLAGLSAGISPSSGPASWAETRIAPDLGVIEQLKAEPGPYLLAQGGVSFARSLIAAGLVDEYRFAVLPVALGSGEALFAGLADELDLALVSSTVFAGGAMGNVYRPVR